MNFRVPKTLAISVVLVTILLMAVVPLTSCKADKTKDPKVCSGKDPKTCPPKPKKPKVCSAKAGEPCPPKGAKSGSVQDKAGKFEPATERTEAIARFEKMQYGAYIHFTMNTFLDPDEFGISSCGAPKGAMPSAKRYNPTALDVDQWISTVKQAGMKYAVLTAKHYIGFSLWDSKYSDYDVAASSNKTDVVAEFVKACRKYGIEPGLYYSLGVDAANRKGKKLTDDQWYKLANNQITELLTNYGPITVFWFDGMAPVSAERLQQAYDTVKSIQPDCLVIVNNGYVDGTSLTYWPTDILAGERTCPPPEGHNPWMEYEGKTYYIPMETCKTSAQGTFSKGWFWEPGEQLKEVKRELLRLYRKVTGRGANLLLNIAIDREGKVPQATVEQLLKLGKTIGKSGDTGSGAVQAKTCSAKAGEPCPAKAKTTKVCSGKDPKTCPPKDTKKACSGKGPKSCGSGNDKGKEGK